MTTGFPRLLLRAVLTLTAATSFSLLPALAAAGETPAAGQATPAVIGQNDLPIHDAARLGSGKDIDKLLKANPAWRDAKTLQGSLPIHLAATNPDLSALKALIAAGADVNARDKDNVTPLHLAAYTQSAARAQVLLEAGADPYAKTNDGRDPTSMARKAKGDEAAGVISLWILKGCKAGKKC